MQQLVRVQKCNDDQTAWVIPVQLCAADCQSCAGCKKTKMQKVKNPIKATCGQVVVLTTKPATQLLVKAGYLMPPMLFFLGLGAWKTIGGVLGFSIGLAIALWATTQETKAYIITGLAKRPEEKGDNDLD